MPAPREKKQLKMQRANDGHATNRTAKFYCFSFILANRQITTVASVLCENLRAFSCIYDFLRLFTNKLRNGNTCIGKIAEHTYRWFFPSSGTRAQQLPHRGPTQPSGKRWKCSSSQNECCAPESSPFELCIGRPYLGL